MLVREVNSRADRRAFIRFPSRIYAEHPLWIAPIHRDERFMMSRRHPFYRHSEAAFFLAEHAGAIVGRIAVLDHRRWNEHHDTRDGTFTLFESVDSESGAAMLFEAAAAWARHRGLADLVGPMGMMPADGHGILVEGFGLPPVLGVGYHPPYYNRLITASGFKKATDYLSGRLAVDHALPEDVHAAADAVATAGGYTLKTFASRRELRRWIEPLHRLYNSTFQANWEYAPVDLDEMKVMADRFIPIADPGLIVLLMHGEDIAGYLLILPDVSDAVRRARGRLSPISIISILRSVRTTPKVNLLAFGIESAHRGEGANLLMYATLSRQAARYRFRSAEVIQVEEGNAPMMRNMETLGVPWTKRHRIYRKAIG